MNRTFFHLKMPLCLAAVLAWILVPGCLVGPYVSVFLRVFLNFFCGATLFSIVGAKIIKFTVFLYHFMEKDKLNIYLIDEDGSMSSSLLSIFHLG